nr:unnamed protein product [Callosobruchus analis]
MIAIELGVRDLNKRSLTNNSIKIFSDSQPVLKALSSKRVDSRLVWNCIHLLNELRTRDKDSVAATPDTAKKSPPVPIEKTATTPSFDGVDNIEFIDQSAPADVGEHLKGYLTVSADTEVDTKKNDELFRVPSAATTKQTKAKLRPKANGSKKKGKKDKIKPVSSAEHENSGCPDNATKTRSSGKAPPREVTTKIRTVTTDTESTKVVTTTTSLNR